MLFFDEVRPIRLYWGVQTDVGKEENITRHAIYWVVPFFYDDDIVEIVRFRWGAYNGQHRRRNRICRWNFLSCQGNFFDSSIRRIQPTVCEAVETERSDSLDNFLRLRKKPHHRPSDFNKDRSKSVRERRGEKKWAVGLLFVGRIMGCEFIYEGEKKFFTSTSV